MPYISDLVKKHKIPSKISPDTFEDAVSKVIEHLQEMTIDGREGPSVYAISRIVNESIKPQYGEWKFRYLNRAHGIFLTAAAEFYRRVVAPYEDCAAGRNGDIYD